VKLGAQILRSGGGTFDVSGGAKLEFMGWARPQSETVLNGGTLNYGFAIGGTVTFAAAAGSEFDVHTQSPGRGDQFEDYHGIHLIYAATVVTDVDPHVVEPDGTTDEARWVPLSEMGLGANGIS